MYYNYTLTPTASYTPHFHIFAMIILLLCSITPSSILKEMESVLPLFLSSKIVTLSPKIKPYVSAKG